MATVFPPRFRDLAVGEHRASRSSLTTTPALFARTLKNPILSVSHLRLGITISASHGDPNFFPSETPPVVVVVSAAAPPAFSLRVLPARLP